MVGFCSISFFGTILLCDSSVIEPSLLTVAGKSALVEALMGFQFNHVGGGTKTRRPITLHMKYNAMCEEPRCYLITEDRPPREEEKTLEELQV